MPTLVDSASGGAPVSPNAGGVEDTVQNEPQSAPQITAEQTEREQVESESGRRAEEEAARETETGQSVNVNA